jgi:hypothetical protein
MTFTARHFARRIVLRLQKQWRPRGFFGLECGK